MIFLGLCLNILKQIFHVSSVYESKARPTVYSEDQGRNNEVTPTFINTTKIKVLSIQLKIKQTMPV
jgi:hypothetical protein